MSALESHLKSYLSAVYVNALDKYRDQLRAALADARREHPPLLVEMTVYLGRAPEAQPPTDR